MADNTDITMAISNDNTKLYVLYTGINVGFKIINIADMITITDTTIAGATGKPTKVNCTDTKLIFSTDDGYINVCNVDGTGNIRVENDRGLFGFDGISVYAGELYFTR